MSTSKFDTTWDVDKYKSPHEPSHQWELRKKFIVENKQRYSEQRLVCLAQTFANIEFMGCRYPQELMDLVEEMAYGVVQPFREQQKHRLKRTFISGADAAESKINRISTKRNKACSEKNAYSATPLRSSLYDNFVRQSDDAALISGKTDSLDNDSAKRSLQCIVTENEASAKDINKSMFNESSSFHGGSNINANLLSELENSKNLNVEEAMNKLQQLKEQIMRNLLQTMDDPNEVEIVGDSNLEPELEDIINVENDEMCLADDTNISVENVDVNPHFSEFIIVRLKYDVDQDPRGIINQSAALCKMSCKYNYSSSLMKMGPRLGAMIPKYECNLSIEDNMVSTGSGLSEKDAAIEASKKAIDLFENICYTIVIKNKYNSGDDSVIDAITLEKKDKDGKTVETNNIEQQTNIGHKLLKMMGWTKGGLGKEGHGIQEPISTFDITGRQGIGYESKKGVGQDFKRKIRKLLEDYSSSNNPYDLVFTSDLTNEQRHEIHQKATRLNLKHKSYGKGKERFMTISRKFQKDEIINQLKRSGGSNEKYQLIYPKNFL